MAVTPETERVPPCGWVARVRTEGKGHRDEPALFLASSPSNLWLLCIFPNLYTYYGQPLNCANRRKISQTAPLL